MNKSLKFVAVTLIAGTSTVALAQSKKEAFADTFASMQALSSNSSEFQLPARSSSREPAHAAPRVSIREMQALSSEAPAWQLDRGNIGADNGTRFAQTRPHGTSFAEYQALSSNSGRFEAPTG